jgi:phosphatidate cytidylyltransferase
LTDIDWILGSLFAAASVASLIGYALRRKHPHSPAIANLNARIRAWWIMIAVGGGALLAGRAAIILLFALISFLALREFVARPGPWEVFLCVLQYVLVYFDSYSLFLILLPVLALALGRTANARWGLILCVYCISYIPALRNPLLVVFVVLIAQVSDIFQYIWGKLFGRHPIAPRISPSKTVEGLIGGILSATALGALLWRITPFNTWQAALMAFTIAVLGFLGGLVMSAIKRKRGIKNWSGLISGHGGMLDRIDSLCFSAPAFFLLTLNWFHGAH